MLPGGVLGSTVCRNRHVFHLMRDHCAIWQVLGRTSDASTVCRTGTLKHSAIEKPRGASGMSSR